MVVRLHLGCGKRELPGFVHVDLCDFSHIDHYHDVRTLPFCANSSADLIYSSHVVEYFDRDEVLLVLREWCRVLKRGGTIRLAVPDLEALIEVYQDSGDLGRLLGPLYGKMEISRQDTGRPGWIYHRTVYDFLSLKTVLESTGFVDVKRYDWRDTIHKDHDDHSQAYYPHMDKENGRLISLNVEARKA